MKTERNPYNINILELGTIVYITNFQNNFIIECKIIERTEHWYSDNKEEPSIERSVGPDYETLTSNYTLLVGEFDFREAKELPSHYRLASCFYWIDEPVGHGLDDGEFFLTLEEAAKYLKIYRRFSNPIDKLTRYRKRRVTFIGNTYEEFDYLKEYSEYKPKNLYLIPKNKRIRYKAYDKYKINYITRTGVKW